MDGRKRSPGPGHNLSGRQPTIRPDDSTRYSRFLPYPIISGSQMDRVLRQVSSKPRQGTLEGYLAQVLRVGEAWYAVIISPKEFTEVTLPAASLRDAARKARAWIEERLRGLH